MVPWGYWEFLLVERELERQKLEEQQRLIREMATRENSIGIFRFVRNWLRAIQSRRKKADSQRVKQGTQTTSAIPEVMHTIHCACRGEHVSSSGLQG